MAHIAIFCDGTWNSAQTGDETHILRLARACAQSPEQRIIYVAGVGTGQGMISDAGRWLSKVGGGLFGWGLNRNIKSAYLSLCRGYKPGDKILIFGFSRGAYTARSLAGLIRKSGILADPTQVNLTRAFKLYRTRGPRNSPDMPHIRDARRALSPDFATSQSDVLWRQDHSSLVRIAYLGVWDTVGALGLPKSILGPLADWWNARYRFHDTALSHLVEAARHAVALDERRALYPPTLWHNLDDAADKQGLNKGDRSDQRPYQQVWFAGNHGVVGGTGMAQSLSAAPLQWIWSGAAQTGLRLRVGAKFPHVAPDALQPAPQLGRLQRVYRLVPWLLRWRDGPSEPWQLHITARLRTATLPDYRPRSLERVLPELFDTR